VHFLKIISFKKPKNRALNSILLAMYKVMSVYPSVNETIIRNLTLVKETLFKDQNKPTN